MSRSRERLRFRRGLPLLVRMLGWPMAVGLGVLLVRLMLLDSPEKVTGLVLGGLFWFVGLVLAAGHVGTVIDRKAGRVTAWKGFRFPFLVDLPILRTRRSLDDYRIVSFCREIWYRGDKGGGATVYPVYLECWREVTGEPRPQSWADKIMVNVFSRYISARRCAERIAKLLELGVVDEVAGDRSVYRPAHSLDEPYTWRDEWTEEIIETPERPADARCSYHVAGGEGIVKIPPRGVPNSGWVFLVLIPVAVVMLALKVGIPWQVVLPVEGVILLSIGFFVLSPRLVWDRVRVSPQGVWLVRLSPLGWRRLSIPADELEELDLGSPTQHSLASIGFSGRVVSARSDRRVMEFGLGLSEAELTWLLGTIRAHLLGLAGE